MTDRRYDDWESVKERLTIMLLSYVLGAATVILIIAMFFGEPAE